MRPTSCTYVHKLGPRKADPLCANVNVPSAKIATTALSAAYYDTKLHTGTGCSDELFLFHDVDKQSRENLSYKVSGLQPVLPTPFLYVMNGFNLITTLQWFCNG